MQPQSPFRATNKTYLNDLMGEKVGNKQEEKQAIGWIRAGIRHIVAFVRFVKDTDKGQTPEKGPATGQKGQEKGVHNNTTVATDSGDCRDEICRGKGNPRPDDPGVANANGKEDESENGATKGAR